MLRLSLEGQGHHQVLERHLQMASRVLTSYGEFWTPNPQHLLNSAFLFVFLREYQEKAPTPPPNLIDLFLLAPHLSVAHRR